MYKRILLAYDGSGPGQKALLDARDIAQWGNPELHLVAVMPPPAAFIGGEGGIYDPEREKEEELRYKGILEEGLRKLSESGHAVRGQVLTTRERMYVQVAKLNGAGRLKIIIKELLPNLLPYLAANLVGAVAGAILASVGLSTLGLGPVNSPSLGLTLYWAINYGALIRQMWWWFMPPIVIIVFLFLGLFLLSQGLDQIANPRLQAKV
jgi:hypothetical protein